MQKGELVQLYSYSNFGDGDILYTGLYVGWDHSDDGWIVLVDGKLETFASTWWKCRRVSQHGSENYAKDHC